MWILHCPVFLRKVYSEPAVAHRIIYSGRHHVNCVSGISKRQHFSEPFHTLHTHKQPRYLCHARHACVSWNSPHSSNKCHTSCFGLKEGRSQLGEIFIYSDKSHESCADDTCKSSDSWTPCCTCCNQPHCLTCVHLWHVLQIWDHWYTCHIHGSALCLQQLICRSYSNIHLWYIPWELRKWNFRESTFL